MTDNYKHIEQYIVTVLSGEASPEEIQLVQKWINESEANRDYFEKMQCLYKYVVKPSKQDNKQLLFDVDAAWGKVQAKTTRQRKTPRFSYLRWTSYAAAAIIALLVILNTFIPSKSNKETNLLTNQLEVNQTNEPVLILENGEKVSLQKDSFSLQKNYATIHKKDASISYKSDNQETDNETTEVQHRLVIPKGKTYDLLLADGTHVWLNAETVLTYPTNFNGDQRKVKLKGEAFFDVAKDAQKPFIVELENMDIKVLGTSFNISNYEEDKTECVTLVSGSVEVNVAQKGTYQITPSEQLSLSEFHQTVNIEKVDTELFTSWKDNKYMFKNARLDDILKKLHRWYDFSVAYEDALMGEKRFSIIIDREDDLSKVLEIISYTSNIKLEYKDKRINVRSEKSLEKGGL